MPLTSSLTSVGSGRSGLPSREGEELAGEVASPLCGGADALDVVARVLVEIGFLLKGVEVAHDDHQDVVEVVRNAAGELADRLHLLTAWRRVAAVLSYSVMSRPMK